MKKWFYTLAAVCGLTFGCTTSNQYTQSADLASCFRSLCPDEIALSLGVMRPKLSTPGRPVDYVGKLFKNENPVRDLGGNAILYPELQMRYFADHGPLKDRAAFLVDGAVAAIVLRGDVDFHNTPFEYCFDNASYRLGIGTALFAKPRDSDANLGLRARVHGYYSDLDITARHGLFREDYHPSGFGYGLSLGLIAECRLEFLPKKSRLFIGVDYDWADIGGGYAELDGFSVSTGIIIPLSK